MENYIDDSRIHEGHRQRMRSKLLTHGQRIFDTYELLEMLLYHVIPYKDTNPISKRLLAAFSGLDGVLSADKDELVKCSGIGERTAELIQTVGALPNVLDAEFESSDNYIFQNDEQIGKYLVDYFADRKDYAVVAMIFDNNMRLLDVKELYNLDYCSAGIKPKAFIDAAISLHASVIVSAHNHPLGSVYPSPGDRATNSLISDSLANVGIMHAEHYVVCGDDYSTIGTLRGFTGQFFQTSTALSIMKNGDGSSLPTNSDAELYPPVNARYNTKNFEYFASVLAFSGVKDARKAAHLLLSKYLTIENALCAPVDELTSMFSEKLAFFIKTIAYVTARRVTDKYTCGREYNRAEISEYLKALFIGDSVEKIYLLTFDSLGKLLGCDLLAEGTINASEVLTRKALEVALNKRASSVAMAHNHPFGSTNPSDQDVNFTRRFSSIFHSCDIHLTDHYIVSGQLCHTMTINI